MGRKPWIQEEQHSHVSTEPIVMELLQCKAQLSFLLAPSAEGAVCDSPGGLFAGAPQTGTALTCPAAAFLHRITANETQGKRSSLQLHGQNFSLLSKFPPWFPPGSRLEAQPWSLL